MEIFVTSVSLPTTQYLCPVYGDRNQFIDKVTEKHLLDLLLVLGALLIWLYSGFVLIRYGKACRHGNDCQEGRSLYSRISSNRSHNTPAGPRGEWSGGMTIQRDGQESVGRGRGLAQTLRFGVLVGRKGRGAGQSMVSNFSTRQFEQFWRALGYRGGPQLSNTQPWRGSGQGKYWFSV